MTESVLEYCPPAVAAELARAEEMLQQRRVVESIAQFDIAEAAGAPPGACRAGRWRSFMLLGDFSRAWLESDVVGRRAGSGAFWDGSPISGRRVIVRCLHGLGDAVQFLRYAPMLREQCSDLIVEVPPAMLELAPFFNGIGQVITWGSGAPFVPPEWNIQVEVMELPYLFRSTLLTLPGWGPYLRIAKKMSSESCFSVNGNRAPRVGIVWSGGEWDESRSISFAMLKPIFSIGSKISFLSLQRPEDNPDWLEQAGAFGIEPHVLPSNGLLVLARAIADLDLVLTVDTMAAHLAGAMGIPVWTLLQHCADWRWLLERSDSPWYPSMRLFRQGVQGEWSELLIKVRAELLRWSAGFDRSVHGMRPTQGE